MRVPRVERDSLISVPVAFEPSATTMSGTPPHRGWDQRDGGRTFAPGRALQAAGADGDRGWHAMALDAHGNAHVMWLDHRGLAARQAQSHEHYEAAAIDGAAMPREPG